MAPSKSKSKTKKDEPTLHQLITRRLEALLTVIIDGVPQLRERSGVAESATAVRALRASVRNAEEFCETPAAGRLDDELAWYGGLLDAITDDDRVSERVATLIASQPPELVVGHVAAQLETELQTSRQRAWGELLAELEGDRVRQLLAQLHRWRADPPLLAGTDQPGKKLKGIRKGAADRLVRRQDTARAALAHDPYAAEADTTAALDRALRARARYAELLALTGEEAGADPLAELRISRQTADLLRGEGIRVGVRSGHNGFSYGLLYALERAHQRELAATL